VKEAVRARFSDGRKLTVSPIHRVWTWSPDQKEPTWKKVSELTSSDRVAFDGLGGRGEEEWLWISPVDVERCEADLYDLTVEHDHSYWSDGFISHNTLATAILEVLMLVHCGRNVVHVAAQEDQAAKAQEYVKDFLERPILRDYKVGDNARTIVYVRYQRKTDKSTNITVRQWKRLSDAEKNEYQPVSLKIEIAICTLKGLNGKHSTFLVMDEIDIIGNPRLYEEAKMIVGWRSGPSGGGGLAITVMVSTRKTVFGFVQKEIDEAPKTKLAVRHWNLLDATEKCNPDRHLPLLPKIKIYYRDDTLEAISEDAWKNLAPAEQERWSVDDGFQGCLQNCRLFAACRGRLATAHSDKRKPCGECGLVRDIHGKMVPRVHGVGECALKPISHTVQKITEVEASTAIAQLLCRKPPTSGLVYPRLDDQVHCLTADQLVNLLKNGDPNEGDAHRTTKEMLIEVLREEDCTFVGGMDFGDTHNFAAVTGAAVGKILIVFDYLEVAGLETNQQVDQCERLKKWRPKIYPDMAGKSSIKIFRKAGFEMREWKKGAGSVLEGIDIVKAKCRPTNSVPEIYFLRDDEWVMRLFKKLARYRWKQALDGTYTNVPDDKDDDGADAFRYMVMNVFPLRNTRVSPQEKKVEEAAPPKPPSEYDQIWSLVKMQQPDVQQTGQVVKKGRFKWIG
jgi:hypothetical protein